MITVSDDIHVTSDNQQTREQMKSTFRFVEYKKRKSSAVHKINISIFCAVSSPSVVQFIHKIHKFWKVYIRISCYRSDCEKTNDFDDFLVSCDTEELAIERTSQGNLGPERWWIQNGKVGKEFPGCFVN